jgi:hypothetical protein
MYLTIQYSHLFESALLESDQNLVSYTHSTF